MKVLFAITGLCAASTAVAGTPKPAQEAYFAAPPADALAMIAGRCMDRNLTVVESDDRHVLCSGTVSGFKGALVQVLMGNSYSTTPTMNVRFQALPIPGGSRVQFSQWLETQMAFGQVRRVALDGRKQIEETRASLFALGGSASLANYSGSSISVPLTEPYPQIAAPASSVTRAAAPLRSTPQDSPGTIDLGRGIKLVPAKSLSGYCISAPPGYAGTGAVNSPAITAAKPLCA